MMLNSIKMKIILAFLFIATGAVTVSAIYVPNSRETSVPPETVVYDFESPDPLEYTELYSEGDLTYYFRESRGTIAIYDNRNDYFWKTGTDLEYNNDIDDDCDFTLEAYEDQFLNLPVETFAGFSGYVNPLLEDSVLVVNNGELKANNSGIADTNLANDIQFSIDGFTLENGKTYQLSFVASGLQSRDIQIQLGTLLNETVNVYSIAAR